MGTLSKAKKEIIIDFRRLGINILAHKTIHGLIVEQGDDGGFDCIGFFSKPISTFTKIEGDGIIEHPTQKVWFKVFDVRKVPLRNKKQGLLDITAEYMIGDLFGYLELLDILYDERLINFNSVIEIIYVTREAEFYD